MLKLYKDSSHYYRQFWCRGGEAHLRTKGKKLKLTTITDQERKLVETETLKFWDEIAKTTPAAAKVVQTFRDYNETIKNADPPHRY